MNRNPFQKRVVRRKTHEEISYVNFSTKTERNKVFFQLRAYGETVSGTQWKNTQLAKGTPYLSLEYITEGECIVTIRGHSQVFHKNDLLLHRNGRSRIHFASSPVIRLKKTYMYLEYNQILNQLYNIFSEDLVAVHITHPDCILNLLAEVKKMIVEETVEFNDSKLSALIYQIFYEVDKFRRIPEFTDEMARILSFIEFSPECFPDMKSLLAEFKVSHYKLCSFFRKHLHTSPMEYVIEKRFGKACWHLTNQTAPVKVIASLCGFNNVPFFTNSFKKRYGMTPTEFRKKSKTKIVLKGPFRGKFGFSAGK